MDSLVLSAFGVNIRIFLFRLNRRLRHSSVGNKICVYVTGKRCQVPQNMKHSLIRCWHSHWRWLCVLHSSSVKMCFVECCISIPGHKNSGGKLWWKDTSGLEIWRCHMMKRCRMWMSLCFIIRRCVDVTGLHHSQERKNKHIQQRESSLNHVSFDSSSFTNLLCLNNVD